MGVFQSLELQQQKVSDLMEMCLQKDDIINKLQAAMDATVEEATRDVYKRLVDTSTCVFFFQAHPLSHSTDVPHRELWWSPPGRSYCSFRRNAAA